MKLKILFPAALLLSLQDVEGSIINFGKTELP